MSEVVRMLEGEGLEERWEEWHQVELARVHDIELFPQFPPITNWNLDSTAYEHAVELSGPR
jgi:hypothetical protein